MTPNTPTLAACLRRMRPQQVGFLLDDDTDSEGPERGDGERARGGRRARGDAGAPLETQSAMELHDMEQLVKETVGGLPPLATTPFHLHASASLETGGLTRTQMIAERITPLWQTDRMERQMRANFEAEVTAIQRSVEPRTLDLLIKRMEEKGRKAHQRLDEQKWAAMIKLRKGLKRAPGSASFARLYHALSQAEPSGRINEARLTSVFARVYGIDFGAQSEARKAIDAPSSKPTAQRYRHPRMHRRESFWARLPRSGRRRDWKRIPPTLPGSYFRSLFHGLFGGFSSLHDGEWMDYRELMCAFLLVTQPLADVRDIIPQWVKVYATHDTAFPSDDSPIPESTWRTLFAFTVNDPGVSEDVVYQAHEAGLSLNAEKTAFTVNTVTANDARKLLRRPPLAKYFEKYELFSRPDADVNEFESMYCPTLRNFVQHKRRMAVCHRRAMYHFYVVHVAKHFREWKRWVQGRGRQRSLLQGWQDSWIEDNMRMALRRFQAVAVAHAAATEIQRIQRGRGAMALLANLRMRDLVVYDIQRMVRGWLARLRFRAIKAARHKALSDCQRAIRGFLGRVEFKRKLLAHVEAEYGRIEQTKKDLEALRLERAAKGVQTVWRARREAREVWAAHYAELEAERQHAEFLREQERQRRTYRKAMVEAVDNERVAMAAAVEQEKSDLRKKEAIEWRVRFREWEVVRSAKAKERNEWEELKRMKREEFEELWEQKKLQRLENVKKFELHLIEAPVYDKKTEPDKRAHQDATMQSFKALTKEMIKQAKAEKRKHYNKKDAARDAKAEHVRRKQQEMLDDEFAEELEEAREELEESFEVGERQIVKKEEAEMLRLRIKAMRLLRFLVKRRRARKIAKAKLNERVVKEYDPEKRAFFYRNRRTGLVSWDKPRFLGRFEDLDTVDRWVISKDDYGTPYYFNPKQHRMSWDQPEGTLMCENCGVRFCQLHMKLGDWCTVCFYRDTKEPRPFWVPRDGARQVRDKAEESAVVGSDGVEIKPPTVCNECEERAAVCRCEACGDPFCNQCFVAFHRWGKSVLHRRLPVDDPVEEEGAPPDAEQAEEERAEEIAAADAEPDDDALVAMFGASAARPRSTPTHTPSASPQASPAASPQASEAGSRALAPIGEGAPTEGE